MSHDAEMDAAMARIGVLRYRLEQADAENARLKAFSDEAQAHIAKEERKSRERLEMEQAENARLKAELADLKSTADRFKAEVERLTELNATLSLRYDATKSMLDGCAKEIEEMEAEVERLTSDLQMEKENEDRLVRLHQDARNEVERLERAGDLMLKCASANMPYPPYATIAKDWLAAKEGKQS